MPIGMVVYWHRWVVGCVVVVLGIITRRRRRLWCFSRGCVVEIVIDRKVGKSGLGKGLSDQFTLLVLQMREVSHSLFLG